MIENCPMRHENGNCIPAGGFCTANKNICEALLNAYRMGKEGTTSDLISRQAAIDAVDKYDFNIPEYMEGFVTKLRDAMKEDLREDIAGLPPAQPEPCGDKSYALWKESYEELKRRMDELTSCSDTISRQAAIDTVSIGAELLRRVLDEVDLVGAEREKYEWGLGLIESCISDIKELPPAQPEPQEGHWINGKCDLCGEHAPFWCMASTYHESNFCPNCGAKMTTSTK